MEDDKLYECSSCGAAAVRRGNGILVTAPRNYPFDQPCAECAERDAQRMREAGARAGYRREKAFFDAFLKK